jgi:hypothetical protein
VKSGDLVGDRFRIEHLIGAGGMGSVYRARDDQTGFVVAVKILDASTAIDVERARRESSSLASLPHPAIVAHIADGVTPDGRLFLAMEWIDGVTVGQRLTGQGFSIRETVDLARRIASALATAQTAGIVHRDIKPSNVLLPENRSDMAMLIDFGIARASGPNTNLSMTRTGTAVGTPGYMSPEQARGIRTLTFASDVFGLGCLLYECATGEPAFTGTSASILAKILFADVRPISETCAEAPATFSDLISNMMQRDLADRIPDCKTVVARLAALGPIPDGPRRGSSYTGGGARKADGPRAHCMVMASRGGPDEMSEPPSDEQHRLLIKAGELWDAKLEVLANGAIAAHFTGEHRAAMHRAACFALALRRVLPGWPLVVSSLETDAGAAAETGTALLTNAALLGALRKVPGDAILVDPKTASMLEPEFEIAISGRHKLLITEKTSQRRP